MSRLDTEQKIENKLNRKIVHAPECVIAWNDVLKASNKTAATRYDFVCKVLSFLDYINYNYNIFDVSAIRLEHVVSYYNSIKVKNNNGHITKTSDSFQQSVWSCLNNFFEFCKKRGLMDTNYLKEYISRPQNKDLVRINEDRILLTKNDFKKIMIEVKQSPTQAGFQNRDKLVLLLFITTGIRETALSSIDINDIDMHKNVLNVTDKGNLTHKYILDSSVIDAYNDWLDDRLFYANENEKALFINKSGDRLSTRGVSRIVEKYTENALGKKMSPHKLRSGFCSILYAETGDIEFVRRAVGHSKVETTQRYIVTDGNETELASNIISKLL